MRGCDEGWDESQYIAAVVHIDSWGVISGNVRGSKDDIAITEVTEVVDTEQWRIQTDCDDVNVLAVITVSVADKHSGWWRSCSRFPYHLDSCRRWHSGTCNRSRHWHLGKLPVWPTFLTVTAGFLRAAAVVQVSLAVLFHVYSLYSVYFAILSKIIDDDGDDDDEFGNITLIHLTPEHSIIL